MSKHKLVELQEVIDEKIGSLREEVAMGTNVRPNPLYVADIRDEIGFLQWAIGIIKSILNRDHDEHQHLVTKKRLEMMETMEFENTIQERVQELKTKLKDCSDLRESDILINEIDTLESTLGRLMDLKYGDKARAIEIAEANHDFKQANHLRKQIVKIQDIESEIIAQYSKTKFKWTS
jgi:hypothetical protein